MCTPQLTRGFLVVFVMAVEAPALLDPVTTCHIPRQPHNGMRHGGGDERADGTLARGERAVTRARPALQKQPCQADLYFCRHGTPHIHVAKTRSEQPVTAIATNRVGNGGRARLKRTSRRTSRNHACHLRPLLQHQPRPPLRRTPWSTTGPRPTCKRRRLTRSWPPRFPWRYDRNPAGPAW